MSRQLLRDQQARAIDAWAQLLRSHAAMRRTLSAQLQAEHGLTVTDYEALLLLSQADERQMRRVDLAEGLSLTPSGVTRLLDGLEKTGCVEKATCSSDARVTYAVLTETGKAKLDEASCSHVGAVDALFEERFTKDELATLASLLGRLPGAAGADGDSCTPDP